MKERFLTVADIAELFQLNPQTVRNWIDRGQLPAIRLGARRVRIRESDLESFIASSTAAATAQHPKLVEDESVSRRGGESDEAAVEGRHRLQVALDRAGQAGVEGDPSELVAALRELGEAARALADVLSR